MLFEYERIATSIASKARQADSRAMSDAAPKSQSVAPIASRRAVSRAAPISPDPSYRDHGQGGRVSRTQAA